MFQALVNHKHLNSIDLDPEMAKSTITHHARILRNDLQITQAQAGLGAAIFAVVYAISAPSLSFSITKLPAKKALLIDLGIFPLGNALTVFTTTFSIYLLSST